MDDGVAEGILVFGGDPDGFLEDFVWNGDLNDVLQNLQHDDFD